VVAKKPKYRLYVINLLPKLRVLDFRKIKQKVYASFKQSVHSVLQAEVRASFSRGTREQQGCGRLLLW